MSILELRAPLRAAFAQLTRYQALENGNATVDLVFTKPEVEELLGWFVDRIEEQLEVGLGWQIPDLPGFEH